MHIFELIGFESKKEIKEFIKHTKNEYVKLEIPNTNYQKISQAILYDMSISFNKSKENCIQNSLLLNTYDPFKETRERNIRTLKKGAKIAGKIILTAETGGNIAAITAYGVAKQLLVGENKNEIDRMQTSYESCLVKYGVERNDAIKLIEAGEKSCNPAF